MSGGDQVTGGGEERDPNEELMENLKKWSSVPIDLAKMMDQEFTIMEGYDQTYLHDLTHFSEPLRSCLRQARLDKLRTAWNVVEMAKTVVPALIERVDVAELGPKILNDRDEAKFADLKGHTLHNFLEEVVDAEDSETKNAISDLNEVLGTFWQTLNIKVDYVEGLQDLETVKFILRFPKTNKGMDVILSLGECKDYDLVMIWASLVTRILDWFVWRALNVANQSPKAEPYYPHQEF